MRKVNKRIMIVILALLFTLGISNVPYYSQGHNVQAKKLTKYGVTKKVNLNVKFYKTKKKGKYTYKYFKKTYTKKNKRKNSYTGYVKFKKKKVVNVFIKRKSQTKTSSKWSKPTYSTIEYFAYKKKKPTKIRKIYYGTSKYKKELENYTLSMKGKKNYLEGYQKDSSGAIHRVLLKERIDKQLANEFKTVWFVK